MPMKISMALLAVGATGAGLIQIPKVDFVVDDFLRPSFAGSKLYEPHTKNGLLAFGLILGSLIGLAGIALAYRIWVARPGTAERIRVRLHPVYELLVNKWYFDEIIDAAIVRPVAIAGDFMRDVFERRVIDETIIGGTTGSSARAPPRCGPSRAASSATTPPCCCSAWREPASTSSYRADAGTLDHDLAPGRLRAARRTDCRFARVTPNDGDAPGARGVSLAGPAGARRARSSPWACRSATSPTTNRASRCSTSPT